MRRCPGACELAEWNVPHAPDEHRSLLAQIDGAGEKGLAGVAMRSAPSTAAAGYEESWRW